MEKDCRNCGNGKERWHDACFCTYYGYIRSKPKKDCWGWSEQKEPKEKEKEKEK